MNRTPSVKARLYSRAALTAILIAPAPAFAQDSPTPPPTLENFSLPPGQNQVQPVTPPVVVPTVPQNQTTPAPTPAPSPTPTPAPPPRATPTPTPAPAPATPPQQQPAPQQAAPPAVDPSAGTIPPAPLETAPLEAIPVEPVPAPAANASLPDAVEPDPAGGTPWLLLVLAALAVAGAIGGFLFWRRRQQSTHHHHHHSDSEDLVSLLDPGTSPDQVAPDPVALAEDEAAPLDPVAAEAAEPSTETQFVEPEPADIAAVVPPTESHADRPWLEFALRPVKAGVSVVDAMVEFELTVGNAGAVAAENVRIAAWLLSASPNQDAEIARFFENTPPEAIMTPIDIAPGDAKRIDAAIALPRVGLNVVTARNRPFFVPLVVIDARYPLPGGGEGRTSAAMIVGTLRDGSEKLGPIWLDRGVQMHDRIEARMHGEPRRS